MEKVKSLNTKKRYKCLDIIKILAIMLVIVYHSPGAFIISNNSQLVHNWNYFIAGGLSVCVPLFFMVNGALLFCKPFDGKKHILKTLKIVIIVYVWAIVISLFQLPFIDKTELTFVSFIKGALTLRIGWCNHLWFLKQLVKIYLVFPFLKTLFDWSKKAFCYTTLIFLILIWSYSTLGSLSGFVTLCAGEANPFSNFVSSVFQYASSFSAGKYSYALFMLGGILFYCLLKLREKLYFKKLKIALNIISPIIFILALVLSFFFNNFVGTKDPVWDGYSSIYTCLMCVSIFVICFINDNQKSNRFTTFLSLNIMGIYLIHYSIQNYLFKIFSLFIDFNIFPMKLILSFTTFLISLLITFLLNKIKYIRNFLKL